MNKKALVAEFIGTFAFVFIGVGAVAAAHLNGGRMGSIPIAWAHGLALGVMISATAAVSGGHLNPAVTIGLWSAKKIDSKNAIGYIVVQCLGSIFAVFLLMLAMPIHALIAAGMGTPSLGQGISAPMGLLTEIILTFFLVFVVYGTAVDARAPKMGGLFIGLTVVFDIMVGGQISGAAMNPARYIGPALLGGGLQNAWLYILGPIFGGVLAAQIYKTQLEK